MMKEPTRLADRCLNGANAVFCFWAVFQVAFWLFVIVGGIVNIFVELVGHAAIVFIIGAVGVALVAALLGSWRVSRWLRTKSCGL